MWRLFCRMLPVTITDFCYGWTLWVCLNWLPSLLPRELRPDPAIVRVFTSGIFLAGIVGDTLGGIISDHVLAETGSSEGSARYHCCGSGWINGFLDTGVCISQLDDGSDCHGSCFFSMELVIAPLWAIPMDIAPRYAGTAAGFMNFGSAVAGIISPWAFGRIADLTGSWHLPFAISAVLMFGGIIASFSIRPERPFVDETVKITHEPENLIAGQ